MDTKKTLIGIGVGAMLMCAPASLAASSSSAVHALPTLKASATLGGKTRTVTRTLALDPTKFQVLSHSSSSVTLGYPGWVTHKSKGKTTTTRAKACARITVRLSLSADTTPAAQVVEGAVPSPATEQGTATRGGTQRAWKEFGTIEKSSYLVLQGLAAQPSGGGLAELRLSARTTSINGPCGGTNSFTVGPGVEALLAAPVV
jgi:hypothetical protein